LQKISQINENSLMVKSIALKNFMQHLPQKYFVKCHNSFVVNLYNINGYSEFKKEIGFKDYALKVPIGDSFKDSFIQAYDNFINNKN
jgi:DNA-binding LytR/AlgR family response regulator